MSEIRRRGTRRSPELTVPAREDAELERDAEKLDAMATRRRWPGAQESPNRSRREPSTKSG